MCGIVGCVGHEQATNYVMGGLETLEYRGYDSAGISFLLPESASLEVVKAVGAVSALKTQLPENEATTAIGHTRWATHGGVNMLNAHPHINGSGSIAVVHNGTIENHQELRRELAQDGFVFRSETDTEVIPHLMERYILDGQEPEKAFESTIKRLVGAYAILVAFAGKPDSIYAARLGSPLVLGVNGSEHFAASDPSVLVDRTKKAIFLDDYEIAELSVSGYRTRHVQDGKNTTRQPQVIEDVYEKAVLGEFPHFMLKEIYDSSETVRAAISGRILPHENTVRLGGLRSPEIREKLRETERLVVVACGTSYHAGLVGERLIEEIAGIPVEVHLASEFKYREEPLDRSTAVLAISQSGETADTIAAIEKAKSFGLLTLGVNNAPGSTIDRITDAGVHCRAGQEVSVASTKAFTSQVTVLTEIALALSKNSSQLHHPLMDELRSLPDKIDSILGSTEPIKAAAQKYADFRNFLYVGRGYALPSALEGALKLKEISYIHAEGCGAGEMKHGTLALIDEEFPTFAIATNSPTYSKTLSNIEEIKARRGPVIALATEGNKEITSIADNVLYVPETMEQLQPVINGVVMQLFAYYIAVEKGVNVDRPRNLAKSVTVE